MGATPVIFLLFCCFCFFLISHPPPWDRCVPPPSSPRTPRARPDYRDFSAPKHAKSLRCSGLTRGPMCYQEIVSSKCISSESEIFVQTSNDNEDENFPSPQPVLRYTRFPQTSPRTTLRQTTRLPETLFVSRVQLFAPDAS